MNRRAFLTRVVKGAAAAAVLAHVPVEWVPRAAGLQDCVALSYLRERFNQYMQGKFALGVSLDHACPDRIVVGRDLYEAAEKEMTDNCLHLRVFTDAQAREGSPKQPTMMFKGARMTYEGRGWRIISMENTRAAI